jgi:hypothetical protein
LAALTTDHAVLLAVAGAIALAAWLVFAGALVMATRPKLPHPGPATMELGAEPPAVANFLVNRWQVTGTAVSATLLDLAARRYLDIEQVAPETFLCRLYAHRTAKGELNEYESAVMDLVRDKATREGTVACEELSLGQGEHAANWWKRFSTMVVDDARRLGLARRRWSKVQVAMLSAGLLVPAALGGGAMEVVNAVHRAHGSTGKGDDFGGGVAMAFVAWVAVLVFAGQKLRAWRDTPAGEAAAARWLGYREYVRGAVTLTDAPPAAVTIWGRNLSYGVALGACRTAAGHLPIGPQRDDEAWSAYGGLWREVRIRYPKRFWEGESPIKGTAGGLGWLVFSGGLSIIVLRTFGPAVWSVARTIRRDASNPWLSLGIGAFAVLFFSVPIAWCLWKLVRALVILSRAIPDLGQRVTFEGQVLRVPQHWVSGSDSSPGYWAPTGYTAIDDGTKNEVRAVRFYRADVHEGQVVRVTMSPGLRHVFSCEVLADATAHRHWQGAASPSTAGSVSAGGSATPAAGASLPGLAGLPSLPGPLGTWLQRVVTLREDMERRGLIPPGSPQPGSPGAAPVQPGSPGAGPPAQPGSPGADPPAQSGPPGWGPPPPSAPSAAPASQPGSPGAGPPHPT